VARFDLGASIDEALEGAAASVSGAVLGAGVGVAAVDDGDDAAGSAVGVALLLERPERSAIDAITVTATTAAATPRSAAALAFGEVVGFTASETWLVPVGI
jgi:hypothetical protein